MSKPYFIELYNSTDNSLVNKFKFVLQGKTVKQIKQSITEKLINKSQIQKDDKLTIKDNDEYQLGSDDEITDVVPDGKVKIYVTKYNQPIQPIIVQQSQIQPNVPVVTNTQLTQPTFNIPPKNPVIQPSTISQITSTTTILDMSLFKLPTIDQNDKLILKTIIPQIRKAVIQIPIRGTFQNYLQFSDYITAQLSFPNSYKAILYNYYGCPFVFNLDLMLVQFPKLDYSQNYYIVFTKTATTWGDVPSALMQSKAKPSMIKIGKTSQLYLIDIKFQIDLQNTINILKYRVYELTKIHPINQILKFGNTLLTNDLQTLSTYGIKEDAIIQLSFKLNSNLVPSTSCDQFYYKDIQLVNQQNQLSIQSLRSHLIVLAVHLKDQDKNKFLSVLQRYSDDSPLVYAFSLLFKGAFLNQASRIALEQGLSTCIIKFIQGLSTIPSVKINEIFLQIRNFFGFVIDSMSKIINNQTINKHFSLIKLQNTCTFTLKSIKNPAILKIDDGQILLVDKVLMSQQIDKGFTFDHYKKPNKNDLKTPMELEDVWLNFKNNHLDNEKISCLYWVGIKQCQNEQFKLSQSHCLIDAYLPKINGYTNLQVNNPLQLKSKVQRYLLIKTKQGRLRIFVSTNKDISKPYNLFNPITGIEQAVNLDLMSGATSTENTQVKIDIKNLKPVITRQPKQAIVVLFDISGSMGSKFFNQPDLYRIGAVKSFFEAFAYRTIAYNLEHVVSLIFFDDKIQVQCDFTEAIFDFNTLIANAKPRGSTRLYDSIIQATNQLVQFSKRYPECKLRILALTDGEDNQSSNSYVDAAKVLVNNNIIIDSFAVGSGCDGLKNITLATGGKCYLTRNLEESLKLFEQQTVLSVRVRSNEQLKSNLSIEQLIQMAKLKPFDQVNSVHKFNVPQIKALNVTGKDLVHTLNNDKAIQQKVSSNGNLKRIIREIQNYTKDPHPFVSIYPSEDLVNWKILLLGPKQTPYENGLFVLYARFAQDYPFRAPEVRFITPIYHCNMNSQGRICHSVLDRNYSPAITFKQIIDCIYGLILTPEPQDPLDNVVASFYLSDYQKYLKNAKQATDLNASHSAEKLVEELFGNIADDIQRQKKIKEISVWIDQAKTHN